MEVWVYGSGYQFGKPLYVLFYRYKRRQGYFVKSFNKRCGKDVTTALGLKHALDIIKPNGIIYLSNKKVYVGLIINAKSNFFKNLKKKAEEKGVRFSLVKEEDNKAKALWEKEIKYHSNIFSPRDIRILRKVRHYKK